MKSTKIVSDRDLLALLKREMDEADADGIASISEFFFGVTCRVHGTSEEPGSTTYVFEYDDEVDDDECGDNFDLIIRSLR